MKPIFSRNMDNRGRSIRGLCALVFVLLAGATFSLKPCLWLGLALLASGLFVAFEAIRGWCGLRACGIKTKW
jgi:hypothetical protein